MHEPPRGNWPMEPEWLEQIARDKDTIIAQIPLKVQRSFYQGVAFGFFLGISAATLIVTVWS